MTTDAAGPRPPREHIASAGREFTADEPPHARMGHRTVIVPLPQAREAWLLFENDTTLDPELSGIPAVAIVYRQQWLESEASIEGRLWKATKSGNTAWEWNAYQAVDPRMEKWDAEDEHDYLEVGFLVLPANPNYLDNELIIRSRYVYFSQEAAEAVVRARAEGGATE